MAGRYWLGGGLRADVMDPGSIGEDPTQVTDVHSGAGRHHRSPSLSVVLLSTPGHPAIWIPVIVLVTIVVVACLIDIVRRSRVKHLPQAGRAPPRGAGRPLFCCPVPGPDRPPPQEG